MTSRKVSGVPLLMLNSQIRNAYGAILIVTTLLAVQGRERGEMLARVASPDSTVDAILMRSGGGATEPFLMEVYLVKHGQAADLGSNVIFGSTHTKGLTLKWIEPQVLDVIYDSASIYAFSNSWGGRVEVRLHPTGKLSVAQ